MSFKSILSGNRKYFCLLFLLSFVLFIGLKNNINITYAETDAEIKARLQAELDDLERQIADQQKIIATTQAQGASLSRDISLLQGKINQKQLEIKKINNNISSLSSQISDKNIELGNLNDSLSRQKVALSASLRNVNIFDGTNNLLNLILNNNTLSDYFDDVDRIADLQNAINQNVDAIRNTTDQVTQIKSGLEDDKDTQLALKTEQQQQQAQISANKQQKNDLLTQTKGQEAVYKKQLAAKQTQAAQIRAALFNFAGGSTAAIPFGDALSYANTAENQTGVPAAFVLAILTQESALGANVGKCYISDTSSGSGYNINSGTKYSNVMKPSRDIPPFIRITSALGRDPLKTIVSCPIPSAGGYGGAMGPAQFIPSTWEGISSRVRSLTGSSNPWNARDAITASALYLEDLGAGSSYLSQIKAACKYYGTGGSSCSYGTQVMSKVSKIQSNIDYINQYGK